MTQSITLYGLKNCDSCRKAQRWFAARNIAVDFLDIRDPAHTKTVVRHLRDLEDWEPLVNRRSTTWRQLPAADKASLTKAAALKLCASHPTLIKRPVLVIGTSVIGGFDLPRVEAALA